MTNLYTTIAVKSAPIALQRALSFLGYTKRDVRIEAREETCPSMYTNLAYTSGNALIANLDDAHTCETRRGVFGGNNGYNRPPADVAWDPDFDETRRAVPLDGAIVVGHIGKNSVFVYVHPTTFAERWMRDVARDAALLGDASLLVEAQSEAAGLSDEECAVLYVHHCWKSGDGRKATVKKHATALDSCVARGLIKRASNGACSITTAGKALESVFRKRGEDLAWRAR